MTVTSVICKNKLVRVVSVDYWYQLLLKNLFVFLMTISSDTEFSGLQIIGMLATDEILQDQNIFIFSADLGCDNQIKDLLRRDGINGCLKKPLEPSKILTAISR